LVDLRNIILAIFQIFAFSYRLGQRTNPLARERASDAWQLEHVTGKYIISDKPMTPEQWVKERAVVVDGDDAVDVTPQLEGKTKID
jgi:hypothetical protein